MRPGLRLQCHRCLSQVFQNAVRGQYPPSLGTGYFCRSPIGDIHIPPCPVAIIPVTYDCTSLPTIAFVLATAASAWLRQGILWQSRGIGFIKACPGFAIGNQWVGDNWDGDASNYPTQVAPYSTQNNDVISFWSERSYWLNKSCNL